MINENTSYTSNRNLDRKNLLTYFLVGGGIGAAVALLFAPKAGSKLRGEIADVTKRGFDATKEKATELRAQSATALGTIREKADALYGYASSRIGKAEEALDLSFESAPVESNVTEMPKLADNAATPANGKTGHRKASGIM